VFPGKIICIFFSIEEKVIDPSKSQLFSKVVAENSKLEWIRCGALW